MTQALAIRAARRLIVNADDFGIAPAVTAGILEAHAAGTVTATSMMVRCAGWEDGVRQAKATPGLEVGLHLNLLVGAPLATVPSLTDRRTGRFLPLRAIVVRALARRIDAGEVTAECEAQLMALGNAGIGCTHIDSHRHVHALPVIRGAVAAVAARRGLPLRRPLESHARMAGGVPSQLHRAVIRAAWVAGGVGAPRTRAADHFIGVSLQGGRRFAARVEAAIDALVPGTTELMVHPGHVDDALTAADGYTWQRKLELAALVSPALGERLRRGDVKLIGFRAL
ncbi:MAG: carbohydrate deacetylase [Gemmatimonadales bacterium]